MPDYIEWYLVELRRCMKNVEPHQRVEELLQEVRGHLDQSVDELKRIGASHEDAVKSAVLNFGHPRTVAKGFSGKDKLGAPLYWALVAATLLALGTMSRQFVVSASGVYVGDSPGALFHFGVFAMIGLGAILAISLVSRKWCSVPITVGCVLVIAVNGLLVSQSVDPYAADQGRSEMLLLDKRNAERQIALRDDWLREYDERVPAVKETIGLINADLRLIAAENILIGDGQYICPMKSLAQRVSPLQVLPGVRNLTPIPGWIRMDAPRSGGYVLGQTASVETASEAWSKHGQAFFAFAESIKNEVVSEQLLLATPVSVVDAEILKRTVGMPVLIVAVYSLLGFALNALVIWVLWAVDAVRRREWRHQLS